MLLAPCKTTFSPELDSLVQLLKTLDEVRKYFNPNLALPGYLFTMSEPTIVDGNLM